MARAMFYEDDMWQLSKTTIRERVTHLYNNCLMADVSFLVADVKGPDYPKVKIPCHKFVLAISSPVFYAMFEGKAAEKAESIELPDCDSEGFLTFLRFLYSENKTLTGSCVMQVLYLALKYMVPSLTNHCRLYLENVLEAGNVMTVLPLVMKLGETHLENLCWKIVDQHTETILQSHSFTSMTDQDCLALLLKRDSLNADEVKIFQGLICWAKNACTRRNLTPNGQGIREAIGESMLSLIRFPLMPQKEFAENLLDLNLLTDKEIIKVFTYYSVGKNVTNFSIIPRSNAILRCKRFNSSCQEGQFWYYTRNASDFISFTVDTPVIFRGVRLFGNKRETYFVTIKICGQVVRQDSFLTDQEMTERYYGFDVLLDQPYPLACDKLYAIEVFFRGPKSFCGTSGKEKIKCEDVQFTFSSSSSSISNGTTSTQGQIAEILFHK